MESGGRVVPRAERVRCDLAAFVEDLGRRAPGRVLNLSVDGLFARVDHLPGLGSRVAVEMSIDGVAVAVHCDVTWVRLSDQGAGAPRGFGARILDVPVPGSISTYVARGGVP